MKQTDVTVTFYLKKSEMNDEGHCPVMAKLVVGKFSEAAFSAKNVRTRCTVGIRTCHG